MTRRLTSRGRGRRSSGCRPPCGRPGCPAASRRAPRGRCSVSPRISRRSGVLAEQHARRRARICARPARRRSAPSMPRWCVRRAHAELRKNTSLRVGRSSARCARGRDRTAPSSSGMTRLRRMISGRVPRTVTTFMRRIAAARRRPAACAREQLAAPRGRAGRRRSCTRVAERLGVGLARVRSSGSIGRMTQIARRARPCGAPPPRRP